LMIFCLNFFVPFFTFPETTVAHLRTSRIATVCKAHRLIITVIYSGY
jgi:hypothetical protein